LTDFNYPTQFKALTKTLNNETCNVWRLATLQDGSLVSGEQCGKISIWTTNNVVRLFLKGHTNSISSLKVLRNGYLASASYDQKIMIWNTQNGDLLNTLKGHTDWVVSLEELNENDDWLVSGSHDKTVKIWNTKTGNMLNTTKMPDKVLQISLLRDENLLAIIFCHLVQIIFVNTRTLKEVRRIDCGDKLVSMVVLSDGNYLATCKEKICIWNVRSGKLLRTLEGHEEGVVCLYLLNDGNLASGSQNGEIKIWDTTSGQLLYSVKSHYWCISSMTTLSDGSLVICSEYEKTIKKIGV
jgi:WD40 repeat protein